MDMWCHPCGSFWLERFLYLVLKLLLVGYESLPGGPLCLSTGGSLTLGHLPLFAPVVGPPGLPGPGASRLDHQPVVLVVGASHDVGRCLPGHLIGVPGQVDVLLFRSEE